MRKASPAAQLSQAVQAYQREIDVLDQALAEYLAVNRTDLRCLDLLIDGPRGARELADAAGLSPSAMTTALDRLEGIGYVLRDRDTGDRRRVEVRITPLLEERLNIALSEYGTEAAAEADRYSDAEVDLLIGFFRAGTGRRTRHAARLRALAQETTR